MYICRCAFSCAFYWRTLRFQHFHLDFFQFWCWGLIFSLTYFVGHPQKNTFFRGGIFWCVQGDQVWSEVGHLVGGMHLSGAWCRESLWRESLREGAHGLAMVANVCFFWVVVGGGQLRLNWKLPMCFFLMVSDVTVDIRRQMWFWFILHFTTPLPTVV